MSLYEYFTVKDQADVSSLLAGAGILIDEKLSWSQNCVKYDYLSAPLSSSNLNIHTYRNAI